MVHNSEESLKVIEFNYIKCRPGIQNLSLCNMENLENYLIILNYPEHL